MNEFFILFDKAIKIYTSGLSWEEKYDLIFSDEISKRVRLDYCDPDTTYKEDVEAFIQALKEKAKQINEIS